MKFSAEKMRSRLIAEGRGDCIDSEVEVLLKRLDGKKVELNLWKKTVEGKIEYYVRLDDTNYPVNAFDCVEE